MGTSTRPTQLPPQRGRIRWGRAIGFAVLGLPIGIALAAILGPSWAPSETVWAPVVQLGPSVVAFLLGARRRCVTPAPQPIPPPDPVAVARAELAEQERSGTIEFILAIGIVVVLTLFGGLLGFIAGLLLFLIFALSTRSAMAEKRAALEKAKQQQSQGSDAGRTPSA